MTVSDITELRIALSQVSATLEDLRVDVTEIKTQTAQTSRRVMLLELWQARVLGAVAVLLFLVTAVAIPVAVVLL